jgi:hypothetical protein
MLKGQWSRACDPDVKVQDIGETRMLRYRTVPLVTQDLYGSHVESRYMRDTDLARYSRVLCNSSQFRLIIDLS